MPDVVLFYPKLRPIEEVILLPISITSVAAPMDQAGMSVEIIDQRVVPDWRGRLRKALETKPAYVGFSCMTGSQIWYASAASEFVKQVSPETPRVWGGVHPTLFAKDHPRS